MGYLEMLKYSLEEKKQMLEKLQEDIENLQANKKEISQLKKEIKSYENSIKRKEEEKLREKRVKELEDKIPSEIKDTIDYRFAIEGYIQKNSAPHIGNITLTDDGKLIFKYGGIPEIDDGKLIMQARNGEVYKYDERKAYDYHTGEHLTNLIVSASKTNLYNKTGEHFSVTAMSKAGKWSYQENNLYQWKDIPDISDLPIENLLSEYSVSDELKEFINENYIPIPQKEKVEEKKQVQETPTITSEGAITVESLKKDYDYVFDNDRNLITARAVSKENLTYEVSLPDGSTIEKLAYSEGRVSDDFYFKGKDGVLKLIPEISDCTKIENENHFSRHVTPYASTRKDSHTFHVWDTSYDEVWDENQEQTVVKNRKDKYYSYVTLDATQKIVKVFESDKHIDSPLANLYHRNTDENGKQCIRLVDLQGNIHSIKEGGKVGEKGLKEKTFGPRGDYQLKVVYKDKEPVYAIFMGDFLINEPNEFCTADELRQCYERQTKSLIRHGISIDEDSCFTQMEEVIEHFNETFMQGNFVPSIDKAKPEQEEKSITELAEELSTLTQQEQQAEQLLQQYEQLLPNKNKQI